MKYNLGRVYRSIMLWYIDGSADHEQEAEFRNEEEERQFAFAIESIFRLCRARLGSMYESKEGKHGE
jgi:hypothetical protein